MQINKQVYKKVIQKANILDNSKHLFQLQKQKKNKRKEQTNTTSTVVGGRTTVAHSVHSQKALHLKYTHTKYRPVSRTHNVLKYGESTCSLLSLL